MTEEDRKTIAVIDNYDADEIVVQVLYGTEVACPIRIDDVSEPEGSFVELSPEAARQVANALHDAAGRVERDRLPRDH